MEVEELEEVRVISNEGNLTTVEITTNFRRLNWRIPYVVEYRERTLRENKGEFFKYSIGIRDLCKINEISCWKYFKYQHSNKK